MPPFQLLAPRENYGKIPSKYACDGENINPPLTIQGTPEGTKSLVLIMDDPDIPQFVKDKFKIELWDHRVIFNMPPSTTNIKENSTPPGIQGRNTGGENAYWWPCPPDGEHRYFFYLHALDSMLDLSEWATKAEVENAIQWHILGSSLLVWHYSQLAK